MKLPEPAAGYGHGCNVELQDGQELYTADQMRKYRADAIAEAEASYIEAVRLHNLTLDELRVSEAENFHADAHKLALALESLLMSTRDDSACAKWWDMAHDALDQHRQLVDKTYPQDYVSAFGKD